MRAGHSRVFIAALIVLTAGLCAHGGQDRPVFASAAGFGAFTPAGKGGKIIRVTNLKAQGERSLQAALDAKGPRIVVFEVAGVIDLVKKNLMITYPFLTVAGQTAPSPGITVIRGGITINTHDVLIQHIRVRPGHAGEPKRSGWEPDGISTGPAAHNVVVDHCSVSWAVDENMSAGAFGNGEGRASHDVTFSNCIIAEALLNATHKKGSHSRGSLIMDMCRNISIIGNLYAHNNRRHPLFKGGTTGVVVNNLIYNPGTRAIHMVDFGHGKDLGKPLAAIVGNHMLAGRNTTEGLPLVIGIGRAFLADNTAVDREGSSLQLASSGIEFLFEKPLWPGALKPLPAEQVMESVVNNDVDDWLRRMAAEVERDPLSPENSAN